jgi:hypothetical protein
MLLLWCQNWLLLGTVIKLRFLPLFSHFRARHKSISRRLLLSCEKCLTSLRIITIFKLKLINFFSDGHKTSTVTSSKIRWLLYPVVYTTKSVQAKSKHRSVHSHHTAQSKLYDTRSRMGKLLSRWTDAAISKCSQCTESLREYSMLAYLIYWLSTS